MGMAGVDEIIVADHACYRYPLAESLAPLIAHLAKQEFSHVFAQATSLVKFTPQSGCSIQEFGQISDVIAMIDQNTYQRPMYAGNAIATIQSLDPIQMITVRPTAFPPAVAQSEKKTTISKTDFTVEQSLSSLVKQDQPVAERPELTSAEIVISGGRGVGDKATFDRLIAIADKIHAAIGASRAAVDAGLAPNDWQVGQTGKVIAPKLYIAVGISGAIQHVAGIKDSKVIIAINRDPDAPIFQIADYGLIAEIPEFLNEWETYLNMIIGVPIEIKVKEFRVGLTPASVRELTGFHHQVLSRLDWAPDWFYGSRLY